MGHANLQNKSTANFGMGQEAVDEVAKELNKLLANVFALYLNTLNCHWNIVDPRFFFLHTMLEEHYVQLAANVDELAERIRKMGRKVPASLNRFNSASDFGEIDENFDGDQMLTVLAESHEKMIQEYRRVSDVAERFKDFGLVDMLGGHLRFHEKTAWMIRSHL